MSSADNQSDEVTTYLEMLWLERGLSENTLAAYRRDLTDTQRVLAQSGVASLEAADQTDLLEVLSHRQQRKLSPRSTARWLSTLKGFYRYAVLQQRIDIDPTQQIELPKLGPA